MFNLSMKQVHNLLSSTYCHWQGPAITWKRCVGSQLSSAMTVGRKGWWGHEEGKGGGGVLHASRYFCCCCMKPLGCWPQCSEIVVPAAGRCSPHQSQLQRALQDDHGCGSALLTMNRSLSSCQDTQDSSWSVPQDHETTTSPPSHKGAIGLAGSWWQLCMRAPCRALSATGRPW